MPKLSRTPKRRQAQEQEDVMEALGDMSRMGPEFQDEPEAGAGGRTPQEDFKALQEQLKEMQRRLDAQDRANMALTTTAPSQEDLPQAPGEVDLRGLPDPVTNPEQHAQELSARIRANIQAHEEYRQRAERVQQTQANQQDAQIQAVWEDFSVAYPEIAKDEEKVEFVAAKVIKDAQRRGIDAQRYMFRNSARFIRDVADAYEKTFGGSKKTRGASSEDDGEEPTRTGGVFGGLEGGQGGIARDREPGQGDMVKELRDMQRKSGFY